MTVEKTVGFFISAPTWSPAEKQLQWCKSVASILRADWKEEWVITHCPSLPDARPFGDGTEFGKSRQVGSRRAGVTSGEIPDSTSLLSHTDYSLKVNEYCLIFFAEEEREKIRKQGKIEF